MNNESSQTPETPVDTPQEETIFDKSDFDMRGYDKHIRNARILLFVMAGLQLVSIAFIDFTASELEVGIGVGLTVFVAGVFLGLAFYTEKRPYTAILIALILYSLLIIGDAIVEPASILKGILLKILIVVLLIRGLSNGREVERWRKALGNER
jgi:hypothetical protein